MRSSLGAGIAAIAALALGIGLAGCGSDSETAPSTPTTESTAAADTAAQAAPEMTIAEYVSKNNIVETPVHRGDPGAPTIDIPVPPGWQTATSRAPEDAYDAMVYGDPTLADAPSIIVYLAKLGGNVDAAKILEYAPAEIQRLPGYEGPTVGGPTKLGGFDATQIGGAYTDGGVKRAVGQMTAVIPGQDGMYMLQLNAKSLGQPDQVQALTVATAVIANQAKITP